MPYKDPEKARQHSKAYREAHREELCEKNKIYCETHTNEERIRGKKYRWASKIKVLSYYSDGDTPRCKHCGEIDIRVLQIDHINGGGAKHIASLHTPFYIWLKREGYPKGYQVLCANCNLRKRYDDESLYVGGNDA